MTLSATSSWPPGLFFLGGVGIPGFFEMPPRLSSITVDGSGVGECSCWVLGRGVAETGGYHNPSWTELDMVRLVHRTCGRRRQCFVSSAVQVLQACGPRPMLPPAVQRRGPQRTAYRRTPFQRAPSRNTHRIRGSRSTGPG